MSMLNSGWSGVGEMSISKCQQLKHKHRNNLHSDAYSIYKIVLKVSKITTDELTTLSERGLLFGINYCLVIIKRKEQFPLSLVS